MLTEVQNQAKVRMDKTIHVLEEDLSKFRAGRASPSLLEGIMVDYYGTATPLSQVSNVGVEGPLMLTVKPWEKRMTQPIEKALRASDLGLNPTVSGDIIRIPLPPLSEERRKELIKKVKVEGETAKVGVRNIRRDALQEVKEGLKKKLLTEDDESAMEEKVQKLTDSYIKKIDQILTKKEHDLMEI